jgi:hypothetical protein
VKLNIIRFSLRTSFILKGQVVQDDLHLHHSPVLIRGGLYTNSLMEATTTFSYTQEQKQRLSLVLWTQSVLTMVTNRSLYNWFFWFLLVTRQLLCNGRYFVTATWSCRHNSSLLKFSIQLLETCINLRIFIWNRLVMAFPLKFWFYSLKLNKGNHTYFRRLIEPEQYCQYETRKWSFKTSNKNL